jgi:hypothetical protein
METLNGKLKDILILCSFKVNKKEIFVIILLEMLRNKNMNERSNL